ncbi:hypothetical protein AJ87_44355 [Rhizobium yanglingense]|nr:hypothetical protein AJ87_44355 [Rhizobium yanglingense]
MIKKASREQLLARRSFLIALAQQTDDREQDKKPGSTESPVAFSNVVFFMSLSRFRMREG